MFGVIVRRLVYRGLARAANLSWVAAGVLVVGILAVAAGAFALTSWSALFPRQEAASFEVDVVALSPSGSQRQLLLVLKEKQGERYLGVTVGQSEARGIAAELQGRRPQRPLTHQLMQSVVEQLGGRVDRVLVLGIESKADQARVIIDQGSRRVEVPGRVGDAVALAMRTRAPIYVEAGVLDREGVRPNAASGG